MTTLHDTFKIADDLERLWTAVVSTDPKTSRDAAVSLGEIAARGAPEFTEVSLFVAGRAGQASRAYLGDAASAFIKGDIAPQAIITNHPEMTVALNTVLAATRGDVDRMSTLVHAIRDIDCEHAGTHRARYLVALIQTAAATHRRAAAR